jgi:hypothetical protein
MKYRSKQALTRDIAEAYAALCALLQSVPAARYREPGVWGDDWTVHDLVAHLFAWHQLFLAWHHAGLRGVTPEMPAPGYRWNETPGLNRAIRERHRHGDPDELLRQLEVSHGEVLTLAESLSEEQLLQAGHFAWTRDNALVTYLGANTASHYRFASKVLKRWLRRRQNDAENAVRT